MESEVITAELSMPIIARMRLKERLLLATPSDNVHGLFFNGVLEAVSSTGNEIALRHCRSILTHSKFFDFFSYPVLDFLRLAFSAAQYIQSDRGGFDGALLKLGRWGMKYLLESTVGKSFLTVAGNELSQVLTNFPVLLQALVSPGGCSMEWTGPQQCRLIMTRDFMPPAYYEGALEMLLLQACATEGVVQSCSMSTLHNEYVISWE